MSVRLVCPHCNAEERPATKSPAEFFARLRRFQAEHAACPKGKEPLPAVPVPPESERMQ